MKDKPLKKIINIIAKEEKHNISAKNTLSGRKNKDTRDETDTADKRIK